MVICRCQILCLLILFPFSLIAQPPGLEWARAFGAMDTEVLSMTTDAAGNVYTAGEFDGTVDFDPQSGVFNLTSAGNGDAFVSKINSDGDLVWAFRLGGIGNEGASQIEVDGTGNVYVTGVINVASGSVDFDPGAGTTLFGPGGYISKFDIDGNLLWVLPLSVNVNDIEIDAANNLYMVGTFTGTIDFDPGPSVFNHTAVGSSDFFAMSLTSTGNFVWAQRIGGSQGDTARSLALDAGGNLCITGIFFSTTVDFDPGVGTANLTITGIADVFILKLDNTGNYVWARRIGSASSEDANGIATDASDNVLITGSFSGTLDFDPGAGLANLTSVGGSDAFVLKLNSSGNYVWANSVGGSTGDDGLSITTDAAGDVYYTGEFRSTVDFDPGPGVFNLTSGSTMQVFVSKLNSSGNFLWALGTESAPGSTFVFNPEISLSPSGDILVAGKFEDGTVDFNPGICVAELTAGIGINTFVMKLALTATCSPTISSFTPLSGPVGTTVTIIGTNFSANPADNIVFFGATQATVTVATTTQLIANVPVGATYAPLTVLNITTDLLAYSLSKFIPTFTPNKCDLTSSDLDPKTDFPSGSNPISVSIGDLDGDGKADMAVGNTASNTISVLRNISTGPGTISYAAKVDFPAANDPETVAIGDLDGDGKLDLAVANYIGFSVSVFRNTSTGAGNINYATKVDFALGSPSRFVAIGDFDGDGKTDLAAVGETSHVVSVFRNISTGPGNISYAARIDFATGAGSGPRSLSIDDFDGDGKADLAVGNFSTSTISVFRNTSTGAGNISFAAKEDLTAGTNPISVSSGDFDGDGKIDLAALNLNSNTLSVFRNTSSGVGNISYATKIDYATGTATRSVTAGDLDGDGNADLVVTNHSSGTVSAFRNTSPGAGNISFATMVDFTTASGSIFASIGDLDNDGKSDLAVANASSNSVSVIRNNPVFSTITNFIPTSGPIGTAVTINGTNFSSTPAENVVQFNGVAAIVMASTPTTLTTSVPAGASNGPISVSIGCSTVVSTTDFVVTVPGSPTITSFTPSSGPVGTTVIITGTNFDPTPVNNTASFNGTAATVTSASATSLTVSVPVGATTGTISVSVGGNTASSSTIFTVTTSTANQAPTIVTSNTSTTIGAMVSLDLTPLISDPDNNLDLSTLTIISPPISGANAQLDNGILLIDYSGIAFVGSDQLTVQVCDILGSCTQQQITINVVDSNTGELIVYTGISPNGDLKNDTWVIENIQSLSDTQENKVSVYNRWGDLIFEVENYDNDQRVFKGINEKGDEVPSGVYFYKIEFKSTRPGITGYLSLKK